MCLVQPSTSDKKARKPYVAPRVRTLTEDDLDNYTIFDVIMPLPGTDVAYPGGKLGERYREFLRMDGLDPDNFVRKQKLVCLLLLLYSDLNEFQGVYIERFIQSNNPSP